MTAAPGTRSLRQVVEQGLGLDPRSGHMFVVFNRRGDQVKILFWDRHGYCLFSKRLEKGRFQPPWERDVTSATVEMEGAELQLILEGIDLRGAKRRPRWSPTEKSDAASAGA